MKSPISIASPANSSLRRSFEQPMVQAPSRHSVDATRGQSLRPEFVQEVRELVLDAKTCPITFESGADLGKNRYVSLVDHDVVYSGPALKEYLEKDGLSRADAHQLPTYRSPLTRRDMMPDALALGLPQNPMPAQSTGSRTMPVRVPRSKKEILASVGVPGAACLAPAVAGLNFGIRSFMVGDSIFLGAAMIGGGLFGGALSGAVAYLMVDSVIDKRVRLRTAAAAQDIEMGQVTPETSSNQA